MHLYYTLRTMFKAKFLLQTSATFVKSGATCNATRASQVSGPQYHGLATKHFLGEAFIPQDLYMQSNSLLQ